LDLLDDLANTKKLRDEFSIQFLEHKSKKKQLVDLQQQLIEQEKLKDYNAFLLEELGQLKLKDQNFLEIEKELIKLDNADNIRELGDSFQGICVDNGPYDQLYNLYVKIEKNKNLDQQFLEFSDRLKSCLIELKELSAEGGSLSKDFDVSPEVHRLLTAKIDAYNHQLNKHRFTSQEQLINLFNELDAQLNENDQLENAILKLRNLIELEHSHLMQFGETLNNKRHKAVPEIEKELKSLFVALKLKEATLNFSLVKGVELKENGLDQLTMLFSANKGMDAVPIEKAASGGELSRVMLALQKMISEKRQLPSVLFDEIDTGVSGDVAEKIGVLLKEMGKNMQLIAISHLPQVAAKADFHLKVEKNNNGDKTNTTVLSLTNEQRVNEIARLMSGEIISNEALLTAKSLMI
jgi:DNA repair protein RecN (Recombination protein N)